MPIEQLAIHQFRNLSSATIAPLPGINVFYGQNGSGKSSILEAIYFLGLGRSFRTNLVPRIIQDQADRLTLFATLRQSDQTIPVGIERTRQGEKKIRLNGETITSLAPLAKQLPIQLLTTDSYRYFHDGPKSRRQFLDWGVFHVEPSFYLQWQRFQKALKQRNAGLKSQLAQRELVIWDHEIAELAKLFDQHRQQYIAQLQPILTGLLHAVLPEMDLQLRYYRGWAQDRDLLETLANHLPRDRQLGYTQSGPHRADLPLYAGKTPVADVLSQGQQKLAAYALHLSQGILLQRLTGSSPIYLIDDLPSELDPQKRHFVAEILSQLQAQVFITGITLHELSNMIQIDQARVFHVEHGIVTQQ